MPSRQPDPSRPASFPNLTGRVDPVVEQYLRQLADSVESTRKSVEVFGRQPFALSPDIPGMSTIRDALQANGSSPLNVTQLLGRLAQPQTAGAPTVSVLPGLNDPLSQDGALVSYNKFLYRFNGTTEPGKWEPQYALGAVFVGTHNDRITNYPPANYSPGVLFWELDRTVFYIITPIGGANRWKYVAGVYTDLLTNKPADLSLNPTSDDVGFLFFGKDYGHCWQWYDKAPTPGFGWRFAPGDPGSMFIVAGIEASPEPAAWWAECRSLASTTISQSDASVITHGLPPLDLDFDLGPFIAGCGFASYTGLRVTESAPTWDPLAVTDDESAHTHGAGTLSGAGGTTGAAGAGTFAVTGTSGPDDASKEVQSGTGSIVADHVHNHNGGIYVANVPDHTHTTGGGSITGNTGSGTAHNHTLSDANAKINAPTEVDGGLPAHVRMSWWMRR